MRTAGPFNFRDKDWTRTMKIWDKEGRNGRPSETLDRINKFYLPIAFANLIDINKDSYNDLTGNRCFKYLK